MSINLAWPNINIQSIAWRLGIIMHNVKTIRFTTLALNKLMTCDIVIIDT